MLGETMEFRGFLMGYKSCFQLKGSEMEERN